MSDISPISNRKLSLLRTPTQRLSPVPAEEEENTDPPEKLNQEMDRFLQIFFKLKVKKFYFC